MELAVAVAVVAVVVVSDGRAYLAFGMLDHVRTSFFKFIGLYGVWHKEGTILKSV